MKVAIMQPYFFPYIGYIQLINSVDLFVFYDDVNFIKKGWINRNRILVSNGIATLSVPLKKASQNKKINETMVDDNDFWKTKLLKTLENSYGKAPAFGATLSLITECLNIDLEHKSIVDLNVRSINLITKHLGIDTRFLLSSTMEVNKALKGQRRIFELCELLGASEYINLPGGMDLYHPSGFNEKGIALSFIEPNVSRYSQLHCDSFVPALSIIDVLMNIGTNGVINMLNQGALIEVSESCNS